MKSLNTYLESIINDDEVCLESVLDGDDEFYDVKNDKKVIKKWKF